MSDRSRARAPSHAPASYVSGAAHATSEHRPVRRGSALTGLLAAAALAACSGGGGTATLSFSCSSPDPTVICIESCNLGCSSTGCARSDIAQNEIVILQFSEAIDPATVGPSSIRFRTASGEQPVGEFFVSGKQVEFVPTLAISGGQTFFGFSAGETYTMTVLGGADQQSVVRSTSGKPFERTLTCTLQVTRGIVDLNNVPPRATMIVPTQSQLEAAPLDTEIVLEFNEMIDATPFLSGTQSPVSFAVRRTRATPGGGFECDPASEPETLGGTQAINFDAGRGISVLTFRPVQDLPGNVCVEVDVTDGVTDLSGRAAQPQTFQFRTVVVPLTEERRTEEFDDDTFLEIAESAGAWAGGTGRFFAIGGDGRHGAFDLEALADDTQQIVEGKRVWTMSTDANLVPAQNTSTGAAIPVTDGRFFFSSMVVPQDVRLRFVGERPPVITVAGRLEVLGHVDVAGASTATPPTGGTVVTGQPGGLAGAGGGNGGNGGNKHGGASAPLAINHGQNGQDARMVGGHAYAGTAAGTRGQGSTVFPTNGLTTSLFYPSTSLGAYTPTASAGGGGGGFLQPGGTGQVVSNNPPLPAQMGPPAAGGTALQLFPFPAGGLRASEHFLVGGAGGGGSASHAALSIQALAGAARWTPGAGGGGGGGAVALRAGATLRIAPAAKVVANGGSTANPVPAGAQSTAPPGGAGSGGSIVLQGGDVLDIAGALDVRGGTGGTLTHTVGTPTISVQIAGGAGANGFVRLEGPTVPPLSQLNNMQPAAVANNVGALSERDDLVVVTSKFYSTNRIFGPEFARYEIRGTIDGVPFLLSDDPAVSTQAAQPGAPLRALFQAARLDLGTNAVLESRPWRTSVRSSSTQTGIASDALNGFRFRLIADHTLGSVILVDSVVVVYRV